MVLTMRRFNSMFPYNVKQMPRKRVSAKRWREGPVKVDAIDRKILQILQTNARTSTSEIAKVVGSMTKVAVAYRIRKLVAQGVIERFTTKINGSLIGQDYLVITRLVCSAKGSREREVSDKIAKIPGVQSVYGLFGPFDILLIAKAKDRQAARDLLYRVYEIGGIERSDTTVPHTIVKESTDINVL
jgi:Lrp/AsnC family leucine-responsive transcriptional regulator